MVRFVVAPVLCAVAFFYLAIVSAWGLAASGLVSPDVLAMREAGYSLRWVRFVLTAAVWANYLGIFLGAAVPVSVVLATFPRRHGLLAAVIAASTGVGALYVSGFLAIVVHRLPAEVYGLGLVAGTLALVALLHRPVHALASRWRRPPPSGPDCS